MCRSRPQPVQQLSAFFAGVPASRAPDSASLRNLTWIAAIVSQRDGLVPAGWAIESEPPGRQHDYSSVWGGSIGGDVGYWLARAIADCDDPFLERNGKGSSWRKPDVRPRRREWESLRIASAFSRRSYHGRICRIPEIGTLSCTMLPMRLLQL
jgi:hypothetical protein